jgi:hypothetical protein
MARASAQLEVALSRLDGLLAQAVALAERAYGSAADPFRGMHIGAADVAAAFERHPGAPFLHSGDAPRPSDVAEPALAWLATGRRSPFELDVVLVALAPKVDLRYELIYAYLQDDVTRQEPGVELVLNLLCSSAEDKLDGLAVRGARCPGLGGAGAGGLVPWLGWSGRAPGSARPGSNRAPRLERPPPQGWTRSPHRSSRWRGPRRAA